MKTNKNPLQGELQRKEDAHCSEAKWGGRRYKFFRIWMMHDNHEKWDAIKEKDVVWLNHCT